MTPSEANTKFFLPLPLVAEAIMNKEHCEGIEYDELIRICTDNAEIDDYLFTQYGIDLSLLYPELQV